MADNSKKTASSEDADRSTSVRLDATVSLALHCYRMRLQRAVDAQPERYPFYLRHSISQGEAICYLLEQQIAHGRRRSKSQSPIVKRRPDCQPLGPRTAPDSEAEKPVGERFAAVPVVDTASDALPGGTR